MNSRSRWIQWLLLAIIVALPFERLPSLDLALGGSTVTIRASWLLAVVLTAVALPDIWKRKVDLIRSPWAWLVGFNLVGVLSAIGAADHKRALMVVGYIGLASVVAFIIAISFKRDWSKRYKIALIGTASFVAAVALYQFFGDLLGLSPTVTGLREMYTKVIFGFPRIQATALEPLFFADFLLLPLGVLLALLVRRSAALTTVLFTGFATLVWMTVSRGAALGLLCMIAITIAWLLVARNWKTTGVIIASTIASGLIAYGMIAAAGSLDVAKKPKTESTSKKFVAQTTNLDAGESVEGRSITRKLALDAFKANPILGVGPGNFGHYASLNRPDRFADAKVVVNNEPLEILAETGLLGGLSFLGFVISIAVLGWKRWRANQLVDPIFVGGFGLAMVGIAAQYQTFSTLYIIHIWVAIGLLIGAIGYRSTKAT